MGSDDRQFDLEDTVKTLLRERSMSMRQLAALTGINVATISKMVTGKQRVNPDYLQRIAYALGVEPGVLFAAAGFNVETEAVSSGAPVQVIQDILSQLDCQSLRLTKDDVERELTKYEMYAKTAEGQQMITEKFPEKRKQIFGTGPFVDELDEMYCRFLHADISAEERSILGGGLLYFVLATDVIPDYMFPIGYFDDALAMQITRKRLDRFRESASQSSIVLE